MSKSVEELREELIGALSGHDWYYQYSDDHKVWVAGNENHARIRALVPQVPDGEALYDQYLPKVRV